VLVLFGEGDNLENRHGWRLYQNLLCGGNRDSFPAGSVENIITDYPKIIGL
jgi:hypothetical protein